MVRDAVKNILNKLVLYVVAICIAILLQMESPSLAQSFADAFGGFRQQDNTPISIDANSLDIDQDAGKAVFSGAVKVVQNSTTITSDRLVVSYSGSSISQPSAIKKLEAAGNVKIQTDQRTAQADNGTFDLKANLVTLIGNVKVQEDNNIATGCKLSVDLKSGNAKLESKNCGGASSGGRVQLQITPQNQ